MTTYENESMEEALYRLATLKKRGEIEATWDDIASLLNEKYNQHYCESRYRKRYNKLRQFEPADPPLMYDTTLDQVMQDKIEEIEKQRIRFRVDQARKRKDLRGDALIDEVLECLVSQIPTVKPVARNNKPDRDSQKKAVYCLLSDIHYGLEFDSYNGKYSPEIAEQRVMAYADKVVEIGKGIDTCYVSLLGDFVSGIIHSAIRIENAENVVEQIVHVSNLIANFLYVLTLNFDHVIVNSVSGNHSRLDQKDDALRKERLDDLIPWYAKARLKDCDNIEFIDNIIDNSIASFFIFNKLYVAVHGDFDKKPAESARRISDLINDRIDYFLSGHMHIAEARFDNTGFIRNGAVVSGGDDYTTKKRLFGPAMQLCLICDEDGVEAMYPVRL